MDDPARCGQPGVGVVSYPGRDTFNVCEVHSEYYKVRSSGPDVEWTYERLPHDAQVYCDVEPSTYASLVAPR